MTKTCRNCRTEFIPTARQLKKYDYLCPPCLRVEKRRLQTQWVLRRRQTGKRYSYENPEKKSAREKERSKNPVVKARKAKQMRNYRRDPRLRLRHEAREMTRRAIRSGILQKKPCGQCNHDRSEAHHSDYVKPLEIQWLCRKCHRAIHRSAALEGTDA